MHPDISEQLRQSYDAFPYQADPITPSHPDVLAAAATLHGLTPPPVDGCRVLDLGCGVGGNLVPMAYHYPRSSFVGIDLAAGQIATARGTAAELALENVRFETMSIADIGDDLGTFDYIICHGVYSWVPAEVQAAILRICARNLAPDGVAYISYNTLPGWHIRGMVREMALFHDRPSLPPADRVRRAREFTRFIAAAVPRADAVYAAVLENELATLADASDSYFLHEELEAVNSPLYFTEFARRAAAAGLRYVTEALPSTWTVQLDADARRALREWARTDIEYEQYLDFVRNRTFRRSLLAHAAHETSSQPAAGHVEQLLIASRSVPDAAAADVDVARGIEVFRTPDGVSVAMDNILVRAALHALHDAHPAALAFGALRAAARERAASLRGAPLTAGELAPLADAMLRSALVRLVELRASPVPCAARLTSTPRASALARAQLRAGERVVTNARHHRVELSAADRVVALHADGTRTHRQLAESLRAAPAAVSGQGAASGGNEAPGLPDGDADAATARSLRHLLHASLLV